MIKKIRDFIKSPELELQEKLFRSIFVIVFVLGTLAFLETILLTESNMEVLIALLLMFVVMMVTFVLVIRKNKMDLAAMVLGLVLNTIVFPSMFFLSGGIEGGAAQWLVIGIFYMFIMFSGKKLMVLVAWSLVVDVTIYIVGYLHPELIMPMQSVKESYLDSIFAVVSVGLAGGSVTRAQINMYERERVQREQQKEKLEQLGNYRNTFFANVSHEIRTPINSILGLNEMILREEPSPEVQEYARSVQAAGNILLGLVNDLLDMSQIEMNKMKILPMEYETRELFGNLIDVISVLAREKRLEFLVDIDENLPSVLYGDEKRVRQILMNLLSNAVKYTNSGSVTLTVHGELTTYGVVNLTISVADTGIGIRKEELEHLYESFHRIDERAHSKTEGSGLGLAISKQLLDLMGGEITVDSIYTKGSTFTVQLEQKVVDSEAVGDVRFWKVNKRQKRAGYHQSFEAPEARILIVDDDVVNCIVTSKLLQETKAQIDMAESGAECLEMTKHRYYHVILMDYLMPDMDGAEALKKLRRQENGLCRDSAVLLVTAHSLTEARQLSKENRFDGYIEKPIQGEALEAEVLKFLPEDIVEYREKAEEDSAKESPIKRVWGEKRKHILITSDCVCEIPEEWMEKYDIRLMYLYIRTDSGRFKDTREIDSNNLTQYLNSECCSAYADSASVEEYEQFFAEALTEADHVIHISMAANTGKSYGIAVAAAKCFDHVRVIDSGHISGGQGLLVLLAGQLAQMGTGAHELIERVERARELVEARYMMPNSRIFYQHGYTSHTVERFCDGLGLHPVLGMRQSRLSVVWMEPGSLEKVWRRFIRRLLRHGRRVDDRIAIITHVGCTVREQELLKKELLACVPFQNVYIEKASVSNACNSGVKTVGIAYFQKR